MLELEFQRTRVPHWAARYFPEADSRGSFSYADLDNMTPCQAEACRGVLVNTIFYGQKRIRQRRAGRISLRETKADHAGDDEWVTRVQLLEEALGDLCNAFGLRDPVASASPSAGAA